MSEFPGNGLVPEWDVGDRMRKALREAKISVQDMADYLGVTRGTVSTWINGRIEPSTQTLRLWAAHCGVDYGWLSEGRLPAAAVTSPTVPVGFISPGRTTVLAVAA